MYKGYFVSKFEIGLGQLNNNLVIIFRRIILTTMEIIYKENPVKAHKGKLSVPIFG